MYLLIIFFPLIGFLVSICFGRLLLPKGVAFITCSLLFLSFICSFFCFCEVGLSRSPVYIKLSPWIDSELFDSCWGFQFDSLSITMCTLVTCISSLVHLYSTGYMSHDPHQPRFMSYLSLFTFFMLMLVSSDNLLQLFFGWEGVGLCSYLLINFWFTRLQANKSAIKAMIINRIGDFGLAIGIFFTFLFFKSVDFCVIFSLSPYFLDFTFFFFGHSFHLMNTISFLFFIGAMGKSAQLFLHTWLPDAMEGPTPVSALIHAATMVTAGVFLIIRCSPFYEYSDSTLFFLTIIGATTSFFAASIGVFQNDLKKVIAYSTCSQLGYMIFACGLSNYSVSIFHVLNHAYFKALLFLSAGSIIHSLSNEQDMRRMGALLPLLPFSYIMILIGSFALMGIPFLTGFYSKDVILEISYSKYNLLGSFAYWIGLISAGLTSFYSFKIIYMTFLSSCNSFKSSIQNIAESVPAIAFPLFVLSFGSIFLGFLTKDIFIGFGTPFWNNSIYILSSHLNIIDAEFIPIQIKLMPFFISIFAASFSIVFFNSLMKFFLNFFLTNSFFRLFYIFFNKKWFLDRLQNDFFGFIALKAGYNITYKIIDKGLIEFLGPFGLSILTLSLSKKVSNLESGRLNEYTFLIFTGLMIFISLIFFFNFGTAFLDLRCFIILIYYSSINIFNN